MAIHSSSSESARKTALALTLLFLFPAILTIVPTASAIHSTFTTSYASNQVTLAWGTHDPDFVAYFLIHRDTTSGFTRTGANYLARVNMPGTGYVDNAVTNGNTYYYQVAAFTSEDETFYTYTQRSATPSTIPGAPRNLAATGGATFVSLNWNPPLSNGGNTANWQYQVYRDCGEDMCHLASTTSTSYVDNAVTAGIARAYLTKAVNANGAGPASNQATATPTSSGGGGPGNPPPSAPQNLNANNGLGNIALNWAAPSNVGGGISNYRIYRACGEDMCLLAQIGANITYTDHTAPRGTAVSYSITATTSGGEGPASNQAIGTAQWTPTQPRNFAAVGSISGNSLTWTAPINNGGSTVTAYRIYRSCGGDMNDMCALSTIATNTSYIDETASRSTTYAYMARAINTWGEGASSAQSVATRPGGTPSAPQSYVVTSNVGNVHAQWTPPADNGGAAITAYNIYRSCGEDMCLLEALGNVLSHTDTTASRGTEYAYSVRALNNNGEGDSTTQKIGTNKGVPNPPSGLATTGSTNGVKLTWTHPTNTGGANLLTYKIYRDATLLAQIAGTNTTFDDLTGTRGVAYLYTLRAVNEHGDSTETAGVLGTKTEDTTPPAAITALKATADLLADNMSAWLSFDTLPTSTTTPNVASYPQTGSVTATLQNFASPALDYLTGGTGTRNLFASTPGAAQKVKLTRDCTIGTDFLQVRLDKVGAPTGNVHLIIASALEPQTTGYGLTFDASTLTNQMTTITSGAGGTGTLLPAGDYYLKVIYQGGDGSNKLRIETLETSGDYADGVLWTRGATTWTESTNGDLRFKILNTDANCPVLVPGKAGNALDFDGVDDEVTIPLLTLGTSFSVGAWVKIDSCNHHSQTHSTIISADNFPWLSFSTICKPRLTWQKAGGGQVEIQGPTGLGTGVWYHFLGTHTATHTRLYINGTEVAFNATHDAESTAPRTWFVGAWDDPGNVRFCDCEIDDVTIAGRAYSASEVRHLHAHPGRAYDGRDNAVIRLNWTNPADGDYAGAQIHRSLTTSFTPSAATLLATTAAAATSYLDITGVGNVTYYYKLVSKDTSENLGTATAQVSAFTNPLTLKAGAPINLNAAPAFDRITLTWTAPPGVPTDFFTAYRIYRSCGEDMCQLAQVASNTLTYIDSTPARGTAYSYDVRTLNAAGEGPPSPQVVSALTDKVPKQVTNLRATTGITHVSLAWDRPFPQTGSSDVTGYRIYRDCGEDICSVATVGTNGTYIDRESGSCCEREYQIRAINPAGEGESLSILVTPGARPSLHITRCGQVACLTWTGHGDFTPTAYTIYRGTNPALVTPLIEVSRSVQTYNDGPLNPGTYYYRLRAINATAQSTLSDIASVTIPAIVTFEGNTTRIAPDQISIVLHRNYRIDLWLDLVRFDTDGYPRSTGTARSWNKTGADVFNFTYPTFRPSNATRDAGAYHLFVTDGKGNYLDGVNICIGPTWTTGGVSLATACPANNKLDDGSKQQLAQESAEESNAIQSAQLSVQRKQGGEQAVFNFLDFFFGDPWGMRFPVMFALDVLAIMFCAALLYRRRQ